MVKRFVIAAIRRLLYAILRHAREDDLVAVLREFRHVITAPLVKRHVAWHQRVRG
jgi:hypothetical protein